MKFEWEEIANNEAKNDVWEATYRAKVVGGWLVRHEHYFMYRYWLEDESPYEKREGFEKQNQIMVFVPDPNHEWVIT